MNKGSQIMLQFGRITAIAAARFYHNVTRQLFIANLSGLKQYDLNPFLCSR